MPQKVKYKYRSLEDFLISKPLNVNCEFDDGWGASYPVKGREIKATILFADISSFTSRTASLTSTETLAFANNYFCWMTAEALQGSFGIVDKYIGDEMMVVFAEEFGSEDPFMEALTASHRMLENDALDFRPHIGIASGIVTVGYVGTPIQYNCSVYGRPVAIASRCASFRPELSPNKINQNSSGRMVMPEEEWNDREIDQVFGPDHGLELLADQTVEFKGLSCLPIRVVINRGFRSLNFSVEDRLREALEIMKNGKHYFPFFAEEAKANDNDR